MITGTSYQCLKGMTNLINNKITFIPLDDDKDFMFFGKDQNN